MDVVDGRGYDSDGPEMQVAGSQSVVSSSSPDNERPNKRRRLAADEDASPFDSDGENVAEDEYDLPDLLVLDQDEEEQQAKKSKYLMHVPEYEEPIETAFVTQLTQPNSSPSRIRGPRWRKRAPSPTPEPVVSRLPPLPTRSMSPVTAFVDEFDEDDEALAEAFLDSDLEGIGSRVTAASTSFTSHSGQPLSRAKSISFRQTTLFGQDTTATPNKIPGATQSRAHNWPLVQRDEMPTHHTLVKETMKTWVYPTNLGKPRDYQFNIVQRGLYHNLLVALPTGLGKTFIAATIMLNWFRWTKDAQIMFVAPTKPLVNQQVDACFNIVGIPRSETVMLTGNVTPAIRAEEWQSKRVFFMTPQTLINDLKAGYADPKKIVLLVVDEAHRATGNYAYVEIVRFLRRFNSSFRVLALTATPGADIEAVQKVIDGLDIARVEIRTESSLDIREYVHSRNVELEIFDSSGEMDVCLDLFAKAVKPVQDKLNTQNAYWGKDPTAITAYGLQKARGQWMSSEAGKRADQGVKGMVNTIFNVLSSLAHGVLLLKFHGIGPFYHKMKAFEDDVSNGQNKGKYAKQIAYDEHFKKLMNRLKGWMNTEDFVGHPKLAYLKSVVLNHFMDAGEGSGRAGGRPPSETRIMVFAHYRDSAEEITRVLNRHGPMIRARVFVGQAASRGSEGMDQKTQLGAIEDFKKGVHNVLVATSVGEEGLDIGEVDLIICYDSSASPIRMLQRMGRTGRKRAGNIVVLLMRGKEENDFTKSKDSYEKMQAIIASGKDFTFHHDRSPRIVPREIEPVVDKCIVEIPFENTQAQPIEPTRKPKRGQKKPKKKFHTPDDAQEGFRTANGGEIDWSRRKPKARVEQGKTGKLPPALDLNDAPLPTLNDVLLTAAEELELEQTYAQVAGTETQFVQVPRLHADAQLQRQLQAVVKIKHSQVTKRLTQAFKAMRDSSRDWKEPSTGTIDFGTLPSYPELTETIGVGSLRKLRADRSSTIRSSGTAAPSDEYDINDSFIDDEVVGMAKVEDELTEMASDLPSRARSKPAENPQPYFVSQQSRVDDDIDLETELPDFTTLVSGKPPRPVGGEATYKRKRPMKRVLDDESDE